MTNDVKHKMTMKYDYKFHALFVVLLITFIAYFPSINNDFTTWDDPGYLTQNPSIKNNSFTDFFVKDKFVMGNYHPLTMISYAIEYSIVGLNPKQYHLDNFILHLLNTALVFWFIYLLSGWQIAAFVAVLFGIHPMHVESVAWISERKDVLYSFFYLASLIFYVYYLKSEKKLFYASTFLFFIFSLLSKGQAVTLPITLLLVDYFYQIKINWKNIYNKIPFLILSIVFGIIAIIAQKSVHVLNSSTNKILVNDDSFFSRIFHFTNLLMERICYASYGLLSYCYKLLLPINLSIFYPYPKKVDGFLLVIFYLSPIILIGIVVLIFIKWRKNKVTVFGLLFFVASILPVLQLLPVGSSIISDRYSYIPSIGLFFVIAQVVIYLFRYKIEEGKLVETTFFKQLFFDGKIFFATVLFSISFYAYAGNQRCKVWKDSETLYTNVLENYPDVYYIQYKLGWIYCYKANTFSVRNKKISSQYFYKKSIESFKKSVQLNSKFDLGWQGLAEVHSNIGENRLAITDLNTAINISPNSSDFYFIRSVIYLILNDTTSSLRDEEQANQLRKEKFGN